MPDKSRCFIILMQIPYNPLLQVSPAHWLSTLVTLVTRAIHGHSGNYCHTFWTITKEISLKKKTKKKKQQQQKLSKLKQQRLKWPVYYRTLDTTVPIMQLNTKYQHLISPDPQMVPFPQLGSCSFDFGMLIGFYVYVETTLRFHFFYTYNSVPYYKLHVSKHLISNVWICKKKKKKL